MAPKLSDEEIRGIAAEAIRSEGVNIDEAVAKAIGAAVSRVVRENDKRNETA